MRMGRPPPRRRPSRRHPTAENPERPKFASPLIVVGQVSPDVVKSVLAPALTDLAVTSVEEYADEMLAYEQRAGEARKAALLMGEAQEDEGDAEGGLDGEEVEVDLDGNVVADSPIDVDLRADLPPPPSRMRLFSAQSDIDELSILLTETSDHFVPSKGRSAPWKVHANAAKFERLLDERYGRLRPFIEKYPEIEVFVKNVQRKYALGAFSPFRRSEDMPVNKTTAVIMLFMMHRNNVRMEALVLAATFCLVGLQPWALVALVALGKWEMDRRKSKRVYGMPRKLQVCEPYYARDEAGGDVDEIEERAKKYAFLERPVGTLFNPADLSLRDEKYDALILGSGPETLYCAALLARAGRKVCVLSPSSDVSECVVMEKQTAEGGKFAHVPFDIKSANVSHVARQQKLLVPALCTSSDVQGGIRFAKIGSASDGYAHSILSVPGLGTDNVSTEPIPVVVNAEGSAALAEYCSTCLGDGFPGVDLEGKDNGNSTSLGYLKACMQINAGASEYYLSKLFASGAKDPLKQGNDGNAYRQATIRPAAAFLDKCLPYNAHVRSLMAALGNANENLCPDKTSMAAHVSHLCAMVGAEGMSYPVGGPRALCHALMGVIEQCGGRVVRGVSLQELLFEALPEPTEEEKRKVEAKDKKEGQESSGPKPRCRGVRLQNGCELTVSEGDGVVVSTLGLIPTFLHLLPSDTRTAHGVPPGLPAVSERRPLMKILVGLNGTKEALDLTGADWYRLPNASLPRDEVDAAGHVKFGRIGFDSEGAPDGGEAGGEGSGESSLMETTEGGGRGKRSKAASSASASAKPPRSKFTSGQSWMKVSFPSAKDPSWADRHGAISTCVVTVEADDDFVKAFDTKPKIFSVLKSSDGEMERLRDRVMRDLLENFPQLDGHIECIQIQGPVRSGLSQNPARYAISGNRPSTPYPGLFVGGSDLTVADSFSASIVGGWLAANAAMGYSSIIDHLYLKKSITSDLERFLDEPSVAVTDKEGKIVDDVAVPFDGKESEAEEGATNAAESTKEE
ncbi:hypothetical protein ACHAXT_012376 [Thalassiosira profunda]